MDDIAMLRRCIYDEIKTSVPSIKHHMFWKITFGGQPMTNDNFKDMLNNVTHDDPLIVVTSPRRGAGIAGDDDDGFEQVNLPPRRTMIIKASERELTIHEKYTRKIKFGEYLDRDRSPFTLSTILISTSACFQTISNASGLHVW
jgi:hypothetical protein